MLYALVKSDQFIKIVKGDRTFRTKPSAKTFKFISSKLNLVRKQLKTTASLSETATTKTAAV